MDRVGNPPLIEEVIHLLVGPMVLQNELAKKFQWAPSMVPSLISQASVLI